MMKAKSELRGVKIGCYHSSSERRPYTGITSSGQQWTERYIMHDFPCPPPDKGEMTLAKTCPVCDAPITINVSSPSKAQRKRLMRIFYWLCAAFIVYALGPAVMIFYILGSLWLLGGAADFGSLVYSVFVQSGNKHVVKWDQSDRAASRTIAWKAGLTLLFIASMVAFFIISKMTGVGGNW